MNIINISSWISSWNKRANRGRRIKWSHHEAPSGKRKIAQFKRKSK